MDVQKVAAQSATSTQQTGQRKDDEKPSTLSSFIDMIRKPMILAGPELDPFSAHNEYANAKIDQKADQPQDGHDNRREDNVRTDRASQDDRPDDEQATRETRDDNNNETRNDDGDEPKPVRADADDAGDDARDSGNGNETVENKTKSDDLNEPAGKTDGDDSANAAVAADKGAETSENAADAKLALAPALDKLRDATQSGDGKAVANAAMTVAAVAPGSDANRPGIARNNVNPQQQQQTPAEAAHNRSQTAQDAMARVGTPAASADDAAQRAVGNAQKSAADQQAQALAAQIKPEKPVKVQVRVNDRGAPSANNAQQSETANAQSRGQTAQTVAKPISATVTNPQQVASNVQAEARAEQVANAQAQAQAQLQAAKVVADSAAEAGLNRAAARVATGSTQAVGGSEASNATGQATAQTQQTGDAQRAAQAQTARQSAPTRPVVQQISVNISKAIADGLDKININLRPEQLGRVEVKLEVSHNGRVSAHIVADRPETLEILRNDARSLEKALQEAGFDTGAGDLSFDLRQQENNQDGAQDGSSIAGGQGETDTGDAEAELAQMLINGEPLHIISEDRVDIRA
ncbi:MAG: flagellar hook-length control protein FliK [Rhodospirillales bacterium]